MGIAFSVIIRLQQENAFGSIHEGQVRISAGYDREEGFHSRSVNQQDICLGQGDHIGILQGIVMQAAGGRFRQIDDGDSVDAFGQVQRHQPDGVEAGYHGLCAACQRAEEKQDQEQREEFLHYIIMAPFGEFRIQNSEFNKGQGLSWGSSQSSHCSLGRASRITRAKIFRSSGGINSL